MNFCPNLFSLIFGEIFWRFGVHEKIILFMIFFWWFQVHENYFPWIFIAKKGHEQIFFMKLFKGEEILFHEKKFWPPKKYENIFFHDKYFFSGNSWKKNWLKNSWNIREFFHRSVISCIHCFLTFLYINGGQHLQF